MISIIIPCYNTEKYIIQCIESCLNQTYKDYEIIVIDDGSTDSSLYLAGQYADKIKVITKQNGGTASALNAGIREAKGDWIHWLSADDVLYNDALENMIKRCVRDDTIYYTNYHILKDGHVTADFIEPIERLKKTDEEKRKELLGNFYGNGSTSMIHKNVFLKCGLFDESLPYFEDYEFWLRCVCKFGIKMELIPIFTLYYREHSEQMSNRVDLSVNRQIREKYS